MILGDWLSRECDYYTPGKIYMLVPYIIPEVTFEIDKPRLNSLKIPQDEIQIIFCSMPQLSYLSNLALYTVYL